MSTSNPATPDGPTAGRSPRAMIWSRRLAGMREFWNEFRQSRSGMAGLIFLLIVIVLALLAPIIAPDHLLDVTTLGHQPKFGPPSWDHPLGTDGLRRDIGVRLVWGARISLLVGFAATAMSMIIGTIVGIAVGYFTGWFGAVLMRIVDFFLVIPSLILAIVLAAVLDRGVFTIVIAIGLTSWAGTARVVRAQTLTVSARDYVDRSRVLGAGHWHVIVKHLLPGVLPLVLANTTLTVGSAIISESTLSFLGLGDATKQSWGTVLQNALSDSAATSGYWWYIMAPGLAIVAVVMAFTMIGRTVEVILNPTLRSR